MSPRPSWVRLPSMVSIRVPRLPGERFLIDCGGLSDADVVRLVEEKAGDGGRFGAGRPGGQDEPQDDSVIESCLARALADAGVPERIGVFVTAQPDHENVRRVSHLIGLAMLARRSGALYLPRRPIVPSLIVPATVVLVFPRW